jgi:F-type H+-transporting ATPase subunit delta
MKVSINQYANTLLELTGGKTEQEISATVEKFTAVLKKDWQMKNAGKIMEKFSQMYNAKHGIVEAQITTKEKIAGSEIKKLEDYIKEKYSAKEIVMDNVVDENIKGGIIIKVGDEVLDGSVAAQLKKLSNALSN